MLWQQIPYFLAVAETGSLRAAAERLGTTHSTVGRHIAGLEAATGSRLFDRTASGYIPTAAGERLLEAGQVADQALSTARSRIQGLDRAEAGTVRLSVAGAFAYEILAPILARFFENYPHIEVIVTVTDRVENIAKLESDISIRFAQKIDDGAATLVRRISSVATAPCASTSYLAKVAGQIQSDGKGLTWLGWSRTAGNIARPTDGDFPRAEVRHGVLDPIMQMQLIRQGVGISSVALYFLSVYPELRLVPGGTIDRSNTLWLLIHGELKRTIAVRRLADFLINEIRPLRPLLEHRA